MFNLIDIRTYSQTSLTFSMRYWAIFSFLFFTSIVLSQKTLNVTITNLKLEGEVLVALYKDPKLFLKDEGIFLYHKALVESDTLFFSWNNVPPGTYSIAFMQDLNGNGKMDFNFFGLPKEKFGFYPRQGFIFRKPRWEECKFELFNDRKVRLKARSI